MKNLTRTEAVGGLLALLTARARACPETTPEGVIEQAKRLLEVVQEARVNVSQQPLPGTDQQQWGGANVYLDTVLLAFQAGRLFQENQEESEGYGIELAQDVLQAQAEGKVPCEPVITDEQVQAVEQAAELRDRANKIIDSVMDDGGTLGEAINAANQFLRTQGVVTGFVINEPPYDQEDDQEEDDEDDEGLLHPECVEMGPEAVANSTARVQKLLNRCFKAGVGESLLAVDALREMSRILSEANPDDPTAEEARCMGAMLAVHFAYEAGRLDEEEDSNIRTAEVRERARAREMVLTYEGISNELAENAPKLGALLHRRIKKLGLARGRLVQLNEELEMALYKNLYRVYYESSYDPEEGLEPVILNDEYRADTPERAVEIVNEVRSLEGYTDELKVVKVELVQKAVLPEKRPPYKRKKRKKKGGDQ